MTVIGILFVKDSWMIRVSRGHPTDLLSCWELVYTWQTLGDEGSSSNPANIENLTKELNTLHRAHAKDQEKLAEMERDITKNTELRNEAWTREDAANERIHELEFNVEDLEMDNAILHENVHMLYAQLHPPHGMVKLQMKKWL